MSVPISYCTLVAAADDAAVFKKVAPGMQRNLETGHFSIIGCEHQPRCRELTGAEFGELTSRFLAYDGPPAE